MSENATTATITNVATPPIVDRETWQAQLDDLLAREKAHTREGTALAAARRRLPMVEVDASTPIVGAEGAVTLLDAFEGRSQLYVYFHMWHTGNSAADQCEGCTYFSGHVLELAYLHSRDVTFATFCEGPYDASSRYRDFMGWSMPWYAVPQDSTERMLGDRGFGLVSCYLRVGERVFETYWTTGRGVETMGSSFQMLDQVVYGRQEPWENSPEGWPQGFVGSDGGAFRRNGRPISQWPRIDAGRSDDLGYTAASNGGGDGKPCH